MVPASSYRDREAIYPGHSAVPALNKISVSVGRRLPAGESCMYNALHDTSWSSSYVELFKVFFKNLNLDNDVLYQHIKCQHEIPYILGLTRMTKSDRIWRTETSKDAIRSLEVNI
jgi:hypothetical protein